MASSISAAYWLVSAAGYPRRGGPDYLVEEFPDATALVAAVGTTGPEHSFEAFGVDPVPFGFGLVVDIQREYHGRPSSSSCIVRYRLRSRLVASTTLITRSGFSWTR